MDQDRIIASPEQPDELILLFHGVGSHPDNLLTTSEFIRGLKPNAAIVSVGAPYEFDMGGGLQWFSVSGVTEENRAARINEVMPEFIQRVRRYQAMFLVGYEHTRLIGFSQGAIMSLQSVLYEELLAGHVVSLSGRMANYPLMAPVATKTVHFSFIHGAADPVIASNQAVNASNHLKSLGFTTSLSIVPGMAHEINREALALLRAELLD